MRALFYLVVAESVFLRQNSDANLDGPAFESRGEHYGAAPQLDQKLEQLHEQFKSMMTDQRKVTENNHRWDEMATKFALQPVTENDHQWEDMATQFAVYENNHQWEETESKSAIKESNHATSSTSKKVTGCTSRIDVEVVTHHKAGCVMSRRAKEFITRSCSKWHVNVNCAQELTDLGGGRSGGIIPGPSGSNFFNPGGRQQSTNTHFLHVERNPYEMVVSGYLYHKEGKESWCTSPLNRRLNNPPLAFYHDQAKVVAKAAEGSSFNMMGTDTLDRAAVACILPDVKTGESYSAYLRRIPPSAGLLAEYIRAMQMDLPDMVANHRTAATSDSAANLCSSTNSGDLQSCEDNWQNAFESLYPNQEWLSKELGKSASKSCSAVDHSSISSHKSSLLATLQRTRERSLNALTKELIVQLQALDSAVLGGALGKMDQDLDCPLSRKYIPSASSTSAKTLPDEVQSCKSGM